MRKLILASLTISAAASLQAQSRGSLQQRITRLLDQPPFDRATWNVYAQDDRGHVLFNRNGDHFSVPASNTKLVVAAAATVLLPADYRVRTSVYANGTVTDGVLKGDLILYGRGDPTWSERCYAVDTLAPGACDSTWTAVDAIADSFKAHGLRRVTGRIVGDGSYFEPTLTHWNWGSFDLNWWYAAPVSGLGFHDNSVDFQITPGGAVDQPPSITWNPDLHLFTFENRARTVPPDSSTTIGDNFFRKPGTLDIWAEGTVSLSRTPWIESFALPDPSLYAARALELSLQRKGVSVEGGAASTTDSMVYRAVRVNPIVEYRGRPLSDIIFPILNTSQNWFAEMLLKILGREVGDTGSWAKGLDVEKRFLMDSVKVDSTAFALDDGSGLSAGNLVTPHTFVQLLAYMYRHPKRRPFLAALPRAEQRGSLQKRFGATPLEGRVLAKTGSIFRVNTLSGYIERADGRVITFSIQANAHDVPNRQMLAQIDSVVVQLAR
ncbi:MAG: D-alanyl-D-alanine carboxypeptidase/D-alanyl-D-alanine-endopeptidase [Gemmatimonadetes bacterium 13_2_20CM_2_65_7]|nr:MAG: D-alanyl-D-alanine carboxypeptidase/D-alanyl-D-alanine-endopeptidase [Gemmatimonadetes bacterium 13_2_20CM_2_65_7]OLD02619.1 MAG: D-alanyl-D-alanine carboxypeptidase/D-alanyl-D-alanine-endopeptidase [Gemmatimonadetes bacterium 13_1_40CM_3_65_8]